MLRTATFFNSESPIFGRPAASSGPGRAREYERGGQYKGTHDKGTRAPMAARDWNRFPGAGKRRQASPLSRDDDASTLPHGGEIGPEVLAELRMPKRVLHGRPQISDLAAAVVAGAAEWVDVDGLVLEQLRDTVGELNLAAGAAFRPLELVENSRRQDVTADDGERRRRLLRLRLLNDLLDALTSVGIGRDADDIVAP